MTLRVDRLDTGDWVVWGATDAAEALSALLDAEDFADEVGDRRLSEFPDEDVEVVLTVADAHLMRKNPCHPSMCGEGHGWHLGYTRNPGHGARPAVLVADGGFSLVPIDYKDDE
jgi:hypothetical protein